MTGFITQVQRDANEIGLATGVVGFCRSLGGGVATSIYLSRGKVSKAEPAYVIKAALENGLPKTSLPALFVAIQVGTASAFMAVPDITSTIIKAVTIAVQDAYAYSFKFVYYCMLAFGLVAFACSFILLPNVDADLTSLVAKKLAGI
jgi:hypothetical protein